MENGDGGRTGGVDPHPTLLALLAPWRFIPSECRNGRAYRSHSGKAGGLQLESCADPGAATLGLLTTW
jgi:hypothetical protein